MILYLFCLVFWEITLKQYLWKWHWLYFLFLFFSCDSKTQKELAQTWLFWRQQKSQLSEFLTVKIGSFCILYLSNIAARNMFLNFNFERMHVLQTVVLRIVCELSGYEKLWVPINCHCCMRGNILCSFREKKRRQQERCGQVIMFVHWTGYCKL